MLRKVRWNTSSSTLLNFRRRLYPTSPRFVQRKNRSEATFLSVSESKTRNRTRTSSFHRRSMLRSFHSISYLFRIKDPTIRSFERKRSRNASNSSHRSEETDRRFVFRARSNPCDGETCHPSFLSKSSFLSKDLEATSEAIRTWKEAEFGGLDQWSRNPMLVDAKGSTEERAWKLQCEYLQRAPSIKVRRELQSEDRSIDSSELPC